MKKILFAVTYIFKIIGKILSFIRLTIVNIFLLAVTALILFSIFQTKDVVVEDNSLLTLSIAGTIVEQKSDSDPIGETINELVGLTTPDSETLLQDILDAIAQAEDDPQINGILLDLSSMGRAGMDQLATIGQQLTQFRQSGKPVIAAEDYYGQNQYYLASHADKIFLNPMGGVYLSGFGLYRLYFKEAIEKLKINYHIFKVGSFKSALEPLTRTSMSSEDRFQSRTWLNVLWENYVDDVASQRGLQNEDILNYINKVPANLKIVGGDLAKLASDSKLIDEIKPRHEIKKYLASLSAYDDEHGFRQISFNQYLKKVQRSYQYEGKDKDSVALIVAQGVIIPGQSEPGAIGADSLAALLRKAASDRSIQAIVLRIDSGGGSAFASEIIRQEILELKKTGKPVVVSMGSVAASGAYWISADADKIFASSNSLTGSIGIFMAVPTFENTLNSVGIYRDGVGTTNLSGSLDLTGPLSSEVKEALQLTVEHGYRTFLSVVSEGRGIPVDKVKAVAQGRVYAGKDALESGLIDQIGSLSDSIRSAAELAGLDDYRTTTLTSPGSLRNLLFNMIGTESVISYLQRLPLISTLSNLLPGRSELQSLLLFKDPNSMYAHCMISYY
jgi:protease-4